MQLLESSSLGKRQEPGRLTPRLRYLPPSLEELLGRGGLRPFLPGHVQPSLDPQFPRRKQGLASSA